MFQSKYELIKNYEDDNDEVNAKQQLFSYEKYLQPKHLIVLFVFILMINLFYTQSTFKSDPNVILKEVTNNIISKSERMFGGKVLSKKLTTPILLQNVSATTTTTHPLNLYNTTSSPPLQNLSTTTTTTRTSSPLQNLSTKPTTTTNSPPFQDLSTTTTTTYPLTNTTTNLPPLQYLSTKPTTRTNSPPFQYLSTTTTTTTTYLLTNTTTNLPPTRKTTITQSTLKYFINTSQCHVPYVDPFSKEALKIFNPKKFKYSNCTNDESLIISNYQISSQNYFLHMNMPAIKRAVKGLNVSVADVRCCYQQIVRTEGDDKIFKLLPCSLFHQNFTLPEQIDYILTECYITKNKTKKTIQKDAFSFIQQRKGPPSITDKIRTAAASLGTQQPSVLLIGIDSLSRINLRRTMPKTFKYLQENRWFELQGYNKVGDNTFPNLMALLTSYNLSTAMNKCKPRTKGGLNKPICNLIWNNFKDYGYKTAYAEDSWWMSTFNYLKKGFQQQPTDYYLRPMAIAVAKNLKVKKTAGLVDCAGRKHYGEYIFDYALQFANTLPDQPLFGLFWTNSFSHNSFGTPATMDVRMLKYLERMKLDGIFQRSIVIFFADHGIRWGPLLSLKSGFLEERLPMMFISLPLWYQNKYPQFVRALDKNQHRLTSPYDIYATMRHILEVAVPGKHFPYLNDTIQGVSVFNEIPENRTCQDAGITEHWCTCWPYDVLPKSDVIAKKVTNLVVNEINTYLANKNVSSVCSKITLNTLDKVEMKTHEKTRQSTYRLTFVANPKKAKFQATVIYNSTANEIATNVEDISRLDSYASSSGCIDLKLAKKFCVCKNGATKKH